MVTTNSVNVGLKGQEGDGKFVGDLSPTLTTPNIGTPMAGVLTSCTGLPVSTGISGLGTGIATFLATPSSANLLAAVTDETGTGALVFATSPTLVSPVLGTPTSGTLTNCTGLPVAGGGTGAATFTAYSVICAGTTATGAFQNVSGVGTSGQVLTSNGAAALPSWQAAGGGSGTATYGTIVTTTSGSSAAFTSLPASIKRITIIFNNISSTADSTYIVQIGDSGGLETTGYTSSILGAQTGNSASSGTSTTGFLWRQALGQSAAANYVGHMVLTRMDTGSNLWISSSIGNYATSGNGYMGAGSKTLSGELDRLSFLTSGTFDNGSVNILYET